MNTEPLTKEEKTWLHRLEKVLMNPPTDRIGFYTIGDPNLNVYDRSRDAEFDKDGDFGNIVYAAGAGLGSIDSACQIHSVAG